MKCQWTTSEALCIFSGVWRRRGWARDIKAAILATQNLARLLKTLIGDPLLMSSRDDIQHLFAKTIVQITVYGSFHQDLSACVSLRDLFPVSHLFQCISQEKFENLFDQCSKLLALVHGIIPSANVHCAAKPTLDAHIIS
jgi:hypothetical protein